jgi:hypothetical protein
MSLSGHMFKKYFFVEQVRFSKAERKKILIPQISCDPFKIFHDPLPGRDPSVEKHWFIALLNMGLVRLSRRCSIVASIFDV